MAYGSAYFQLPVLAYYRLAIDAELEASVTQLAVVGPVVVDTANGIVEGLERQQILGVVDEVVDRST